jgi:hypothetical protein
MFNPPVFVWVVELTLIGAGALPPGGAAMGFDQAQTKSRTTKAQIAAIRPTAKTFSRPLVSLDPLKLFIKDEGKFLLFLL